MISARSATNRPVPPRVDELEARNLLSSSQFVSALYADLLHRAPQPSELSSWVAGLDNGVPPIEIIQGFTGSAEFQNSIVQSSYRIFLDRQATPAESAGWVHALQNGLGELQLEANLVGSAEFVNLHGGTTEDWLKGVYAKVLGRPLDAAAFGSWSQVLQAGATMEQVALGIVTSPESLGRLVTAAYKDVLGRATDPAGLANWVSQLQQGLQPSGVLAQLAASAEFVQTQGGLDPIAVPFPVPVPVFVPVPVPVPVPVDTFFDPFIGQVPPCFGFGGSSIVGGGFSGSGSGF